jgi:hypothetical protein
MKRTASICQPEHATLVGIDQYPTGEDPKDVFWCTLLLDQDISRCAGLSPEKFERHRMTVWSWFESIEFEKGISAQSPGAGVSGSRRSKG